MTKREQIADLEAEVARLRGENEKLIEAMLGMARLATPAAPYVDTAPQPPWSPLSQPVTPMYTA